MNALVSPLKSNDLDRPIPKHFGIFGLVGRMIWKIMRPTRWQAYCQSVKRQIGVRGVVPDQAWETSTRLQIARQIEEILAASCWSERFSFHPDDPWLVIGQWEIGDLSELDAWWKICKLFELPYDKEYFEKNFARRIEQGMTFGDLVTIIEEHRACIKS